MARLLQIAVILLGLPLDIFGVEWAILEFVSERVVSVCAAKRRPDGITAKSPGFRSRFILHGPIMVLLVYYTFVQILCQLGIVNVFLRVEDDIRFAKRFLAVCGLSRSLELMDSAITSRPAAHDSSRTLLSIALSLSLGASVMRSTPKEYTGTGVWKALYVQCGLTTLAQIWIHLMQLFRLQRYNSAATCILDNISMACILREILTVNITHAIIPLMPFMWTYAVMILTACIACTLFLLQGFVRIWKKSPRYQNHIPSDGSQEFSTLIVEFAISQCQSYLEAINGSEPFISTRSTTPQIDSYYVSGYLNQYLTIPKEPESSIDESSVKTGWAFLFTALVRCVVQSTRRCFQLSSARESDSSEKNSPVSSCDLHRFITSRNYYKFFLKPKKNGKNDSPTVLLPEEDTSLDYKPADISIIDSESESSTADNEELQSEVEDLIADLRDIDDLESEEMEWAWSTYAILQRQMLVDDDRLTRSRYGDLFSDEVIGTVLLSRILARRDLESAPDDTGSVSSVEFEADSDTDKALLATDMGCILCHDQPKNIVVWPCRCLSVCDTCRLLLGQRGYKKCLKCGAHVNGFSKINLV